MATYAFVIHQPIRATHTTMTVANVIFSAISNWVDYIIFSIFKIPKLKKLSQVKVEVY